MLSRQLRLGQTLLAAVKLNLLARVIEVDSHEDLDRAFAAFRSTKPDAVLVSSDTFFLANASRVAELALANQLPVFSTGRSLTEAGIPASYGADPVEYSLPAATYVQKVLRGARPADLAIEQPTKFDLLLNARTAKSPGIDLPAAALSRANEIIR